MVADNSRCRACRPNERNWKPDSTIYSGTRPSYVRVDGSPLRPDRSLRLVEYTRAGFGWGHDGDASAQLAAAILLDFTGDEQLALEFHQGFKHQFVARFAENWQLSGRMIRFWLDDGSPKQTNTTAQVPLVAGGQGRTDEEVRSSRWLILLLILIAPWAALAIWWPKAAGIALLVMSAAVLAGCLVMAKPRAARRRGGSVAKEIDFWA